MDDQPIWLRRAAAARILAVPYPQELNDIPAIVVRQATAPEFADMIVDQFDEMLEQSRATQPLVMGIALHPYIVGQPYRLRHLRRALAAHRGAAGRGMAHHGGRDRRPCRHAAGGDGAVRRLGGDGAMTRLGGGLP